MSLSVQEAVAPSSVLSARIPRIALLSASHFVNDSYANYLPMLLPLLMAPLNMSLSMAGVVLMAYNITSSIIQPYLGHIADRHGTRAFSFIGTSVAAVCASIIGIAPSYLILICLAALAGTGTASFHPQSAAMANALAGPRKGTVMSVYLLGGSLGFAIGPLVVVLVVERWGLGATPILVVPGLVVAWLLYLYAPRAWTSRSRKAESSLWQAIGANRSVLTRLLAVVIVRSWAYTGAITFLPFYFTERAFSSTAGATIISGMLFAGAAGGLIGGFLSDHLLSRRTVIAGSLMLASPFLSGLLFANGPLLWVSSMIGGGLLLGSFAIITVEAQELLPQNIGMASGLMLGLSIGIGGLIVGPMGLVAEHTGVASMVALACALPLLAGILALTLPEKRQT